MRRTTLEGHGQITQASNLLLGNDDVDLLLGNGDVDKDNIFLLTQTEEELARKRQRNHDYAREWRKRKREEKARSETRPMVAQMQSTTISVLTGHNVMPPISINTVPDRTWKIRQWDADAWTAH